MLICVCSIVVFSMLGIAWSNPFICGVSAFLVVCDQKANGTSARALGVLEEITV